VGQTTAGDYTYDEKNKKYLGIGKVEDRVATKNYKENTVSDNSKL